MSENETKFYQAMSKALKLTDDQVKEFTEKPDAFNEFFKTFISKVKTDFRETMVSDKEFTKQFYDLGHQAATGQLQDMPRNQLKSSFGLTPEDVDGKSIKEIASAIQKKFDSNKSKDKVELEQAITTLNNKVQDLETGNTKSLKDQQDSFDSKWNDRNKIDSLRNLIPDNVSVSRKAALPYLQSVMGDHNITKDGELLTKDGGKVWKDDAKTVLFSASEYVSAKLNEAGMIKKEEETKKPGDGKPIVVTLENGQPKQRHMNSVQAAALAESEAKYQPKE